MTGVTLNTRLLYELCDQALNTEDPKRIYELSAEILRMFDNYRRELNLQRRGQLVRMSTGPQSPVSHRAA